MKVLLANKFWYPRGGAEQVAMATKNMLEKAGHETAVFGMRHPQNIWQNDFFVDYVDYDNLGWLKKLKFARRFIYNAQARNNFSRLIEQFRPDVIHFHNIYHQLSFSLLDIVRAQKIPAVMTLHDYKLISPNYNLFHHGRVSEECAGGKYYRCFFANCLESPLASLLAVKEAYFRKWKGYEKDISVYVSPSNFLKKKFIASGFKGEIKVIPNPFDASAGGLSGVDGDYVLYFGRLAPEKGVSVLLDAAKLTPEIPYVITGNGPEAERLKKKAKENNLTNVRLTGYQSGEALEKLIQGARLAVLPSLWHENYSVSVMEAKARGKIVVASASGGLPEQVPAEFLTPPGDAPALAQKISRWFNAPAAERQERGRRLREEVERVNNPSQYAREIVKAYEEAIAKDRI